MGLDSVCLHRILKDETRRKIVILLHGTDSHTYSDLLEALKTRDRGRLNYHLKSLTPLLAKNESGYTLNEQGMQAWRVLQEFSYAEKARLATIIKYGRSISVGLVAIFYLSYNHYVSILWLLGLVTAFSALIIALIAIVKLQYDKVLSCRSTDCIDASLHETLANVTRRKIVRLLRENGALSYSELMKTAQVMSSGQMNYHIKVLGDLVSTDEKGKYSLNEKGIFAYTSLHSYQNKKSSFILNSPRQQWVGAVFVAVLFLVGIFFLYSKEIIGVEVVLLNLISVFLTSSALFYFSKVNDNLELDKVKNT
jgi:DNA-binding transcriptional ArsR family regulator